MNDKDKALTLRLIGDGLFLPRCDEELRRIQAELRRYFDEHGERAKGAKARLTIKVTLAIEAKTGAPSIKAEYDCTLPAAPADMSMAAWGSDEHGPCLKVQASGSYHDVPGQRRFTTIDGRRVDPQTGELASEDAPSAENATNTA